MKRQQIIPQPITLNITYPKSFIDLLNTESYKKETPFIGYGNPSAKILIVGKEIIWGKGTPEEKRYCLDNFNDWNNNIQTKNPITIKSEVLYPEDDIHSEAFENFNPLFPHYFRYNKVGNTNPITEVNGKFTHQNLTYSAGPTWYKYQKLINFIYPNRRQNEYVDFFNEAFITELSEETRHDNNNVRGKDAEKTRKSIEKRCPLLKEPYFQSFPIVIYACNNYTDKIFPFIYGFEKSDFIDKGWFSILERDGKLYVCTWQFSARISDKMLEELANVIKSYLNK